MSVELRCGDCVEETRKIPDASIDLILTSPPYDNLRKYGSGSAFDFEALADECKRVLKPGGVLVWVVGDQTIDGSETGTSFRQALHFKSIGLRLHDTMAYAKLNPMPLNHDRYEQEFEYMFVISKGKPASVNKLVKPCKNAGKINNGTQRHDLDRLTAKHGAGKPCKELQPLGNIWSYPVGSERTKGHPAVFPLQLAIDHVLSWTNPGDLVLDPFSGSGTTGEACLKTGRDFIGIEKHEPYHAIAQHRLASVQPSLALTDF